MLRARLHQVLHHATTNRSMASMKNVAKTRENNTAQILLKLNIIKLIKYIFVTIIETIHK